MTLETRADLVVRPPAGEPRSLKYRSVSTHSLGGLAAGCAVSAIFYGGACWYYLALPNGNDIEAERRRVYRVAEEIGTCAFVDEVRVVRTSWGSGTSAPPELTTSTGDRLAMADLRGSCEPSTAIATPALEISTSAVVPAQGLAPSIVAVFAIEDPSRSFDPTTTSQLTDYLGTRLAKTRRFKVVPPDQLRAQLVQEKSGTYRECFDQKCQIELGKAVAAEKSIATKLLKLGDRCALTATLFDLRTEATEAAATTRTSCVGGALIDAVDDLVTQLAGEAHSP